MKIVHVLIFVLVLQAASSQNLVVNPSFEIYNKVPTKLFKLKGLSWHTIRDVGDGVSDMLMLCSMPRIAHLLATHSRATPKQAKEPIIQLT